jgi:hypothetical protein
MRLIVVGMKTMRSLTISNVLIMLWAGAAILVSLWIYAPWAVALVGVALAGIAAGVILGRRRRARRGWWIEHVSLAPSGDSEFWIVYHEGEKHVSFPGTYKPRAKRDYLYIPSHDAWDRRMPVWARGRREIIVQRLLTDRVVRRCQSSKMDPHNPPPAPDARARR